MKTTTKIFSVLTFHSLVIFAFLLWPIATESLVNGLEAGTEAKSVLLLTSWDDVYSLEYNNYWRSEVSEDFVEGRYDEVLDAASLGDDFFNQFLQLKGITHILVPESTSSRGQIFYKWGERGSININLNSRFFTLVETTSGPFASALYKVRKGSLNSELNIATGYSLEWSNVDWWFYQSGRSKKEVGMYAYGEYSIGYDSGENSSWFYDLSPDRSNELVMNFKSKDIEKVNVRLGLCGLWS